MQVAVSNMKLMQRYDHSAAPLTISLECTEVVLFGGQQKHNGLPIADTAVLRFGKFLYLCSIQLKSMTTTVIVL